MTTHLNKQFIAKQKEKLEREKKKLEEELNFLVEKNKKAKKDWGNNGGEKSTEEEEIEEAEEYGNLLPITYVLESDIKKIQESLEKIKNGGYGICVKCKNSIIIQRMKAYPQAKFCIKCQEDTSRD
jgi:DnaK suppressor protein